MTVRGNEAAVDIEHWRRHRYSDDDEVDQQDVGGQSIDLLHGHRMAHE